ncbi:MAG: SUMF1/EgtB/PvdO family nonheme iron enzyme [Marinifilaceae bacterium]
MRSNYLLKSCATLVGGLLLSSGVMAAPKTALDKLHDKLSGHVKQLREARYADSVVRVMRADTVKYPTPQVEAFYMEVLRVRDVQEQLKFISATKTQQLLQHYNGGPLAPAQRKEIESIFAEIGQLNIYTFNDEELSRAHRLLKRHRALLLQTPRLKDLTVVASAYNHGSRSREVMCGRMGMPPANYSSMYSGARKGAESSVITLRNVNGQLERDVVFTAPEKKQIADLQLHWDGNRVLYSQPNKDNKWRIYERDLTTGKEHEVVQIDEPDLEFCDGNYLPDGRIVFSSNVGYHGVPCVHGADVVGNLSLYNPDDKSFRRLTFDQDGNWNPVVMNNGRVMYTRWEYTDLTHYFSRIVFHMNPDGTENKALYGSGSYFPNSTYDMRPLPSSGKFVGIITGHHGVVRSGRLIIFDPAKSRKEEKGMVQELPFKDKKIEPVIKDYLVDGVWPQFVRPYPLDDETFLVGAKLHPGGLWGIYLVDTFDNLICLAEHEDYGMNMPIEKVAKALPPVIPDRVNLKDKEATIFIQDIYEGEGLQGVKRGEVKELRVFAYEYAYIRSISDHDAHGIQSGWDIKRLLGTVPVEEDGSVIFKAPANTPISLQPLDKNGAAIQWMRSWFTPMPGETVSCIGCHEDQNQIPIPKKVMAAQRKPHAITVPEGGTRAFTFNLEVQPILDRACVACHTDNKVAPNLRAGRMERYKRGRATVIDRELSMSYWELMRYVYRQGPEADMYVLKPYEHHAGNSELVQMLQKGHHGVELTDKEWKSLYNWIDFNAPYYGVFNDIKQVNGHDQYQRRISLANKYNNGAGVDWRKELEAYASTLQKQQAVMPATPKAQNSKTKSWNYKAQHEVKEKTMTIAPGVQMEFVWVPAGNFYMGNNEGAPDEKPQFKASVKKGFWMSKHEVTNSQYCALVPEHDSRIIGQFWKDHTTPGYPANKPQQPVIRVSQQEALNYCQQLARAWNGNVTLPTETEWEWACRGGSDKAFYFGQDDFARYENLADAQLSKMAVTGVNPMPMRADDPMRKFWDFMPRMDNVDDGAMISTEVGKYGANLWGLHDMHGNVSEWTRSEYVPYPLKNKTSEAEFVVARGGSWRERPRTSTASARKAFLPWQKVHNVGFRIIIYNHE